MEIVHIDSWNDFLSATSECDGWAFRGLPDADWQLFSSLSRYLHSFVPDRTTWRQREERALRIFRRKAHNYLPDAGARTETGVVVRPAQAWVNITGNLFDVSDPTLQKEILRGGAAEKLRTLDQGRLLALAAQLEAERGWVQARPALATR